MKLGALAVLLSAAPALAAAGPEIEKTSIVVTTQNHHEYHPAPGTRDELTYSWTPRIQLKVYGPVVASTEYVVEFSQPDGKPWVALTLTPPELAPGVSEKLESSAVPVEKAIVATGEVPFVIHQKGEGGKDQVVFKGKASVKKFHVNAAIPKYKNTFYYYVDEDWRLPIGELWWNVKEDPEAPALMASVWVRGTVSHKDVGYLSFEGKQYCTTAKAGDLHDMNAVETSFGADKQQWTQAVMWFNCTRAFNKHTDGVTLDDTFHIANKHPGQYEIKMMRDGKVARVGEFTVGADGKIGDTGIVDKNGLGGHKIVFPFRIAGDTDGKVDAKAWKGGLYGNPLAGFSAE